jgi:hypothetical protein
MAVSSAVRIVALPEVVVPAQPVSAVQVPAMLRDFLINRKSIKEVSGTRGFQSVTENFAHTQKALRRRLLQLR